MPCGWLLRECTSGRDHRSCFLTEKLINRSSFSVYASSLLLLFFFSLFLILKKSSGRYFNKFFAAGLACNKIDLSVHCSFRARLISSQLSLKTALALEYSLIWIVLRCTWFTKPLTQVFFPFLKGYFIEYCW